MVSEVADEEKEALEAAVLKEEAKDKEAEASKDYTGLIPEVRSTNSIGPIPPPPLLPPLPVPHCTTRCTRLQLLLF